MITKLKILSSLVVLVLLQLSCGSDEAVVQRVNPESAILKKEPEMIRFERSLAGMGAKYGSSDQRVALDARATVTSSSVEYLTYYGEKVDKDETDEQILSRAFKLHNENIVKLKNQQKQ